jgi:5'-methylthioadenosine phosphorylase
MIGIIGGSGLYKIPGFRVKETVTVKTPYGEPSDDYVAGELSGRDLIFLPRHSSRHDIPPHEVNYIANIWGFKKLGVDRVIAVNAVGGINSDFEVGKIVIPDQIMDFTRSRISTFYTRGEVVHVDFTEPFCPELRAVLLSSSESCAVKVAYGGTYVCVEGPRLETASEIRFFSSIGADIVGMTVMPEAILAREVELCYASLSVVTNYAAGITSKKLTTREVIETFEKSMEKIKMLLSGAVSLIPEERRCPCKDALRDSRM